MQLKSQALYYFLAKTNKNKILVTIATIHIILYLMSIILVYLRKWNKILKCYNMLLYIFSIKIEHLFMVHVWCHITHVWSIGNVRITCRCRWPGAIFNEKRRAVSGWPTFVKNYRQQFYYSFSTNNRQYFLSNISNLFVFIKLFLQN